MSMRVSGILKVFNFCRTVTFFGFGYAGLENRGSSIRNPARTRVPRSVSVLAGYFSKISLALLF